MVDINSENFEHRRKLLVESFDKMIAYTNLLVALGYAGFFGLWTLTQKYITEKQALWAALFMLVSLSFFIFFEVYKTFSMSRMHQKLARILMNPEIEASVELTNKVFSEYAVESKKIILRQNVIWATTFSIALIFGLLADGLLLYAFVQALIRGYGC